MQIGVARGKRELLPVSAADAELVNPPVPQQVVAAPHDAGVAELGAQVVVPQVGVGVKVDDVQFGVAGGHGPHGAQGDQVLPAQQQRELPVPQNLRRPGFNVQQGRSALPKQSSRSPLSNTAQSVRSAS